MKICLFLAASLLSPVTWAYTTVKNASLDADGIRTLAIRTYSGPLVISGTESDRIEVEVVIDFEDDWDAGDAETALADGLVLELERRGGRAELNSWVGDYNEGDFSFFTWGLIDLFRSGKPRPFSHLEVRLPRNIDLEINDYRGEVIISSVTGDIELRTGAGPVEITGLAGDLLLEDGSGDIRIDEVTGNVEVRDGSGNIDIARIGGRLTIHDGSGNIEVRTVGDLLDIRDGSGNVRVADLKRNSEIYDGSGNIDVNDVGGTLSLSDGSGAITVIGVGGDLVVNSRGSGGFIARDVKGEVFDSPRARENTGRNFNYNYRNRDLDIDEDIDIDIDIDEDFDVDIDEDSDRR